MRACVRACVHAYVPEEVTHEIKVNSKGVSNCRRSFEIYYQSRTWFTIYPNQIESLNAKSTIVHSNVPVTV